MDVDLMQYFQILWRYKWLILGLCIVAVAGAYYYVTTVEPIYETSATILVQDSQGVKDFLVGDLFSMSKGKADTFSKMITTRTLLYQVSRELDLKDEEGEPLEAGALADWITVSPIKGTELLQISMEHKDPKEAQSILNKLIELFQSANINMNKSALTSARTFIENQKKEVELELQKVEEELLEYKMNNNVVLPTEEAKQGLQKLVEVESLKAMAAIELESTTKSIDGLQYQLLSQSESMVTSKVVSNNPLIKQYKGQLTDLETKLVGLKAQYTSSHPEVEQVTLQINNLHDALKAEVEKEVTAETSGVNPIYQSLYQQLVNLEVSRIASEAKVAGYDQLIAEYEGKLSELPAKELELVRLERKAKVTGEIYTMLMTRSEEIKISEVMETSGVHLIDPPYIPKEPIKPNKKMTLLIAGLLGIFLGTGIAFVLAYMDKTVKSADEIEKLIQVPVIGSIPDMNKIKK